MCENIIRHIKLSYTKGGCKQLQAITGEANTGREICFVPFKLIHLDKFIITRKTCYHFKMKPHKYKYSALSMSHTLSLDNRHTFNLLVECICCVYCTITKRFFQLVNSLAEIIQSCYLST